MAAESITGTLIWVALGLLWWTRVRRNQERNEFQRVVVRRDDPDWHTHSYAQALCAYRWSKAYRAAWIMVAAVFAGAIISTNDTSWRWGGVALSLLVVAWWGLRVRRLWHEGLPTEHGMSGPERKVTTADVLRDA